MKRQRRNQPEASLSFLDIISCGFGAIVLLLVIAKIGDPAAMREVEAKVLGSLEAMQIQLFDIRGEAIVLDKQLRSQRQQLSELRERIARLQAKLASVKSQSSAEAQSVSREKQQLKLVMQVLSEEMQRLQGPEFASQNELVGGIPADSEYVIFVIDTSGSMQGDAWKKVQKEMLNILDIYPEVKGLQVLNDMGQYMYPAYSERWINDSPEMRDDIVEKLRLWAPFSNSSPVEGIEVAIRNFYQRDHKISIYILGDDFSGRSIRRVVAMVDGLNQAERGEQRLVRIHAIGFPVQLDAESMPGVQAIKFAALMRELSYNNGGTFVGLNSLN